MGHECDLISSEKFVITFELVKSKPLEIFKSIGRYHQTMKKFGAALMKVYKRDDNSHSRVISQHSLDKCETE